LVNGQQHVTNFNARQLCIRALSQIRNKNAAAHFSVLAIDDHDAQEALLAHLYRARLRELVEDELSLSKRRENMLSEEKLQSISLVQEIDF